MANKPKLDEDQIEAFEAAWEKECPRIEDFLPTENSDTYVGTLRELVIIALEFRWKEYEQANSTDSPSRTSEERPPSVEGYVQSYPVLGQSPHIEQLVEEEFTIRRRSACSG